MRVWFILCAALCVTAAVGGAGPIEKVHLIRSDSEGVEAIVHLPDPVVQLAEGHPGYHIVTLASLPSQGVPGQPRLPQVAGEAGLAQVTRRRRGVRPRVLRLQFSGSMGTPLMKQEADPCVRSRRPL